MTDDQWQDQQQKLHDVQKRRFLRRSKESPTPYELLANMRPLTDRVTQEDVHAQASIKHQLTITLGHVIRDILAPIRLQIPEDASLAEQEMYRLLMERVYALIFGRRFNPSRSRCKMSFCTTFTIRAGL